MNASAAGSRFKANFSTLASAPPGTALLDASRGPTGFPSAADGPSLETRLPKEATLGTSPTGGVSVIHGTPVFPRLIKTSSSAVTIVRKWSLQLNADVRGEEPVSFGFFFFILFFRR